MHAGTLKQKVSFYEMVNAPDGAGGTAYGETLYWSTSASVKPSKFRSDTGRELQANQTVLIGAFDIIVRYRSDKTPGKNMVIKYENKVFTITSIQEVNEAKRSYFITALEKS